MLEFFKGTVTPKDWAFVAVVLAMAGLIGVGFYFGVYQKQQLKLAEVQTTLDSAEKKLKNAREIAAQIDQRRELAKTADEIILKFQERLPEKREIPTLLAQFESTARTQGLTVELKQLDTMIERNKETIPYEIIAYGKFHDIVQFINDLETDKRYLKVSNLDIQEERQGVSEARFQLSTFRFIQNDEADVASDEPGQ